MRARRFHRASHQDRDRTRAPLGKNGNSLERPTIQFALQCLSLRSHSRFDRVLRHFILCELATWPALLANSSADCLLSNVRGRTLSVRRCRRRDCRGAFCFSCRDISFVANPKSETENLKSTGLPSRGLGATACDLRNKARLRFTPAWQPSLCASLQAKAGGGGGIRTHEAFRPAGFQDRSHQPLDHPSENLSATSVPPAKRRARSAIFPLDNAICSIELIVCRSMIFKHGKLFTGSIESSRNRPKRYYPAAVARPAIRPIASKDFMSILPTLMLSMSIRRRSRLRIAPAGQESGRVA